MQPQYITMSHTDRKISRPMSTWLPCTEYLIELCHSATDIPARCNLRSSSQVQLLVPRYRKQRSGKRGSSVSSPQLWNLLPADIRFLNNEHQLFRKRLKTHYMQQSMLCHWGSMSTAWTLLLLLSMVKVVFGRHTILERVELANWSAIPRNYLGLFRVLCFLCFVLAKYR